MIINTKCQIKKNQFFFVITISIRMFEMKFILVRDTNNCVYIFFAIEIRLQI